MDASLAPGQRVRVQSGHTGVKSRLYKCVYVDGELKERTLLHNDTYNASKAIYRVGPAAPAVAEPTETAPVETPPALALREIPGLPRKHRLQIRLPGRHHRDRSHHLRRLRRSRKPRQRPRRRPYPRFREGSKL